MNTNNVKKYAPRARKAFIAAISKQAAKYGITEKKIEVTEKKGDMVLIGDRPFPASVIRPRERLVKRIEHQSFDQVIEHVAYSWFNRLCAIRYMERKGFLDHGRRVLGAADGSAGVPQILEECLDVDLPGLDQTKVRELKLDGNKDEELYRELLLAQCHALHQAMPFLFEAIADESELLLPENLTKTDSLIRDLVESVPDEDWEHIEIIGWLYQFYISEKKDQVIGKVVKSEDIPAATQLFTPNWIVQYLVQNSVGRQWLQTYPDSPLKEKMPYYIAPAEQLAAITPSEISPESIKVLDPACGSGHILIEAYKVLKAIYEERGYRIRDIPKLILENNLHGLDIDDRAGQLAGFTLMMLAREDDRRVFDRDIRLNVLSIQESEHIDLPALWQSLNLTGEWGEGTLRELPFEEIDPSTFSKDERYQLIFRTLDSFKKAKTFGSLINVPENDFDGIKELVITLTELEASKHSTLVATAANQLIPYVHQALLLARKYDAVVANPPYMGSKGMNALLKSFSKENYPNNKSDLFAVSIERYFGFANPAGYIGLMTPFTWMFLKSYEPLRNLIIQNKALLSLIQPEYHAFFDSAYVPVCTFIIKNRHIPSHSGSFVKLTDFYGADIQSVKTLEAISTPNCAWLYTTKPDDFLKIPSNPVAYWVSERVRHIFESLPPLKDVAPTKQGLATGSNDRFLRDWYEVALNKTSLFGNSERARWFPCNKGGQFRKWYGNNHYVVNWENDGDEIKSFVDDSGKLRSRPQNQSYYFREGLTWSAISSSYLSMRYSSSDYMFETKGAMCFPNNEELIFTVLGYANSKLVNLFLSATSPTLDFHEGPVGNLPYIYVPKAQAIVEKSIKIAKADWDAYERSWNFRYPPLLKTKSKEDSLESRYLAWIAENKKCVLEMQSLEEKNNSIFISEYGLCEELEEHVPLDQISITVNPEYRYGRNRSAKELNDRFRQDTMEELISYSIGCMMGRYSLDSDGLVYADSGGVGFEPNNYISFPADSDGIIPITYREWFRDDATNRLVEFLKKCFDTNNLQNNIDYLANGLSRSNGDTTLDKLRRYLSSSFFKYHMKCYRKKPIYWLFSSGKQKAFECLVYLHRYNEGTLARMRTEYVIPLTAKMEAYVKKLENDKEASDSAAEIKRHEKEISQLHKQQAELSEFDEKLRHYADQRINLDLGDGVKVNYGKFGDLLAEVKAITGKKPEVIL